MKEKTEQTTSRSTQIAEKLVQGSTVGAFTMIAVTPFLKWTNHVYEGKKMQWNARCFSGAGAYASSAAPGYAVSLACKEFLRKNKEDTTSGYELFSSFTAGAFSGFAYTPFETFAQYKQLAPKESSMTARQMLACYGVRSFFRGGASIMVREGLWATVYMSAIQMASDALQKQGVAEQYATPISTLLVAGSYGLFSSPLNQLRYRKQAELTNPPSTYKSYTAHARDIFNQKPQASSMARAGFFFKAAIPRTVTTTVAAGVVVAGTEVYNQAVARLKS